MMQSPTPNVSVVLIAYNQAAFIRSACESILLQTQVEPMEIIWSDDASNDDTFAIMQSIEQAYTGQHTIVLNRMPHNVGLIAHINHVVRMSTGDIIVYAAGDDIAQPNRISKLLNLFQQHPHTLLVHSAVQEMDVDGVLLGLAAPAQEKNNLNDIQAARRYSWLIGATCAWQRTLWQVFGDIQYARAYEDMVMAFRAQLLGGPQSIVYADQPMVLYRVHTQGLSQAGRNKPNDRTQKRLLDLKNTRIRMAVCQQRLQDARRVERNDIVAYLTREKSRLELIESIYTSEMPWYKLLGRAIQQKRGLTFALAYIKYWKIF
ncbi:MAG: glycosyl transferase [Burkholderiaceae bacterium]|nr:glycosyl transferase [Burkholderiaceae bacterium]